MSLEVRTPVNAVIGFFKILYKPVLSPDKEVHLTLSKFKPHLTLPETGVYL